MAGKHHISHRGLTDVMSAVVSSGSGNINDLFLSKGTVHRQCNSMREQRAKSIFEINLGKFMIQKVTDICCTGMEKCYRA